MVPLAREMPSPRIGPNAVTRVAEVLVERFGVLRMAAIFRRAGLAQYVDALPKQMVDEAEVIRLHVELRATLDAAATRDVAREAGRRTGDYLLAHRIPRPVQWLLKSLPPPLAARVLLAAITRHAWTFAGSGRFEVLGYSPVRVSISGNPLARGVRADMPQCDYYAATFERLFCALVSRHSTVVETHCEAAGAAACVFEMRRPRAAARARATAGSTEEHRTVVQ
jgi:divinyl protochlorophyllide a 8-vinyl-reductase